MLDLGRLSRNSTWRAACRRGDTVGSEPELLRRSIPSRLGRRTLLTAEPLFSSAHTDTGRLQHPGQATTTCSDFTEEYIEAGHQNPVLLVIHHVKETLLVLAVAMSPVSNQPSRRMRAVSRPTPASRASPAGRGHTILRARPTAIPSPSSSRTCTSVDGNGKADATGEILDIDRIDADRRRGFGQAIARQDRHSGQGPPAIGHGPPHRRAAADRQPQRGKIQRSELVIADQRVEQRVDSGNHRELPRTDFPHEQRKVAGLVTSTFMPPK